MSLDTGRERIDEERQRRRTVDRLTPAAKPGQTGELLAPSPSPESADQSQPRERNESSGPNENPRERTQGLSPLPAWLRRLGYYGLAPLFVAAAALLRWLLPGLLRPAPFLVFYLAWVAAAVFGGLGPGLLATLLSWLCIDFFFDPTPGRIDFMGLESITRLLVFLAGGLVISVVGEQMRRSRRRERRQGRELAAANAALQASEEKCRVVADNTYDWEFWQDPERRFRYVSPSCERITGYAAHEFMNHPGLLQEILHPEDLPAFLEHQREQPSGCPGDIEFRVITRRGEIRWIHHLCQPVYDKDGRYAGSRGSNRDITERKQADEVLRESEERFRKVFDEGPIGMVLTSRDFGFFRANPAFCAMLGYTPEEMNRLTVVDVTHPEHRAADRNNVERLWQGEIPVYRTEKRYIAKNGNIRWGNLSASLIQDRAGRPLYALTIVEDITERKRAEEALRASRSMLQSVMENVPQGIFWKDRHSTYLGCNRVFAQAAGLKSPEDIVGKTDYDLPWSPEQAASFREYDRRIMENDTPEYHIIEQQREANGKLAWVETSKVPLRDAQGNVIGILGTYEDITERKQAEQDLRESRNKYQALIETTADFIWEMDTSGKYTYCSPQMRDLWGYEPQDMIGKTPFDVMPPEDRKQALESFMSLAKSPKLFMGLEASSYDSRGRLIAVEISGVPFFDADGRWLGYRGISRDVTERQRADEALRELNATLESRVAERTEELEQRARELQKLTLELTEAEERERKRLAEILHDDLQQVLAAAKFQVGLLSSRVKNDAESQEIVGHTRNLLIDAIAKSRSLSHELSAPALSQTNLCEAFEWLAQEMQTKHGFTVHLDMGERIELASEPLRVLLYKAAQESLFNVIKHAGVHEAKLRLRHHRGRIRLSVSDAGRGFNPTEPGYNLGFGLLSIRERVGCLGGRLKIRSAVGKGSIFLVAVPDSEVREDE